MHDQHDPGDDQDTPAPEPTAGGDFDGDEAASGADVDAASEPASDKSDSDLESDTGEDEPSEEDRDDEYAELFAPRSFGGEFIWAEAPGYVAKILRVKDGQNVVVSTQSRRDMVVMLTGGRAVLEVKRGSETEHLELVPAEPHPIRAEQSYRLLALSEVELFTIYTPL